MQGRVSEHTHRTPIASSIPLESNFEICEQTLNNNLSNSSQSLSLLIDDGGSNNQDIDPSNNSFEVDSFDYNLITNSKFHD